MTPAARRRAPEHWPTLTRRVPAWSRRLPDVTEPTPSAPGPAQPEPRQRWRVVFRRTHEAEQVTHREVTESIEDALSASTLPLHRETRRGGRPRLSFGAPLPVGMVVERDLFDLWLTERRPIAEVRPAVSAAFPRGFHLDDLHDVWLGTPALAAQVVGAEYVVELRSGVERGDLDRARELILRAAHLPRERTKGTGTVAYDLRPLLAGIEVVAGSADRLALAIAVRFDPQLGSGRPEEVLAALAECMQQPLETESTRRSRLILVR